MSVPNAQMYNPVNVSQQLQVPNQLTLNQGMTGPGIMGLDTSRYVQCPDGTVLDIKTQKVVFDPSKNQNGTWGNPKQMVRNPFERQEQYWTNNDIYGGQTPYGDTGLTKSDIEYNQMRAREDAKLINNMSDLQKQLLKMVDSGAVNSKSTLR